MSSKPSRRSVLLALLALTARPALPAADPLGVKFDAWSASRSFVVTSTQRG